MLGEPVQPGTARALVTGASGGIGACFAEALARLGYDLLLVARDAQRLSDLAARLERQFDVEVKVVCADLTRQPEVDEVVREITDDPRLEIVVNAAGTASWGRIVELDARHEQTQIDVNVAATHQITLAAVRAMTPRRRGAVINVSSLSAFYGQPYTATYAATKAFLLSFSEALHEELRGTGVVVQALCPGATRTNIFASVGADPAKLPAWLWLDARYVVQCSLAALRRGRAVCVPGLRYQIIVFLVRITPRWITRRLVGKLFGRFDDLRAAPILPAESSSAPSTHAIASPLEVSS